MRDYESIKRSIEKMIGKDQDIRQQFSLKLNEDKDALKQTMQKIDHEHTQKLKQLINEIGWKATIEAAGDKIWLLIQHADHDTNFQRRAYKALKHYGKDVIPPWQIAFLYDRILCNTGKPQKYGSQLVKNRETKTWEPAPLREPQKVNDYRRAIGLEPLDEYITKFNHEHSLT